MSNFRHGHKGKQQSSTYTSWQRMVSRCTNPKDIGYANYGGRGIGICERWRSFQNFLADMGEKPTRGMSVERRNNNADYGPANCFWATRTQQNRNTRANKITLNDARQMRASSESGAELARRYHVTRSLVNAIRRNEIWRE